MKKIAVAVKDNGKKLEHFGICEYFLIYNYDPNTHNIEYNNVIFSSKDHDKNHEEWEKSADAIDSCDILICQQIGLSAKSEVENRNIKVIESNKSTEDALDNYINKQIKKDDIII
ncbi:MAG: hypothetical protein LUG89_00480 [Methanosphaera sp.]|nr:hypothetical protein [Methanosphaera sp.]